MYKFLSILIFEKKQRVAATDVLDDADGALHHSYGGLMGSSGCFGRRPSSASSLRTL